MYVSNYDIFLSTSIMHLKDNVHHLHKKTAQMHGGLFVGCILNIKAFHAYLGWSFKRDNFERSKDVPRL